MNRPYKSDFSASFRLITGAVFFLVAALVFLAFSTPGKVRADADPTGSPIPSDAPSPTGGAEPTPAPAPGDGIESVYVLYKSEEISIESSKPVYYCILKKQTDTAAKPVDFIPAATAASGGTKFLIDISILSASKNNFVGITTSLTPGADGLIPVINIPVTANQKKITFNINWAVEGDEAHGNNIIQSVQVVNNNSTIVTYEHTSVNNDTTKPIDQLSIQWRKGANGAWASISTLTELKWESYKNSGAVLYFRLDAKDQGASVDGYRYSKENKIKVSITKAPAVKLDVSKLTVSLKNGMQIRATGTQKWATLLPYGQRSTVTDIFRSTTLATPFDPFTESTSAKVSYASLDDIYRVISMAPPAEGSTASIDVRIAATTKKPASRVARIVVPGQSKEPTATLISESSSYKVTALASADTLIDKPAFEFCLVNKNDLKNNLVDFANIKWSTVKLGTVLKPTLKSTYNRLDGARVNLFIKDANVAMLIRRRGAAATKNTPVVLASKYVVLDVPAFSTASLTPTPSVAPSPSVTSAPTGTP